MKKARALAQKLQNMATNGATEGERENARRLLYQHMHKNAITCDELESEDLLTWLREFSAPEHESYRLLVQVVYAVVGNTREIIQMTEGDIKIRKLKAAYVLVFRVTPAEMVEISARFELIWLKYLQEKEMFFQAFLRRNELAG